MGRIDIQDKVRKLATDPREEDQTKIDDARQALQTQMFAFAIQKPTPHVTADLQPILDTEPTAFDDLDGDEGTMEEPDDLPSVEGDQWDPRVQLPEQVVLPLPSALPQSDPSLRQEEIFLRTQQAGKYIQNLREAIADKSFQYSHVIRKAPRKAVRTRARTTIANLNNHIGTLARGYKKCWAALRSLDADPQIFRQYRCIEKGDLAASTAILTPNITGSTTLKLSWIWQTEADVDPNDSPEAVTECMS